MNFNLMIKKGNMLVILFLTVILFQTSLNLSITPIIATEVGDFTPPSSGSWVIDEFTVVENREILLNGSIRILSGGSLTLDNVTLIINSGSENYYNVTVYQNGALYTTNNATITAYDTQYHWYLSADADATIDLYNSTFLYGGLTSTFETYGLLIASDFASIVNCTFNHMMFGIIIPTADSHSLIINNTFDQCATAIHIGPESTGPGGQFNVSIEGNKINGSLIGVNIVYAENITIDNNNITKSTNPLYIQEAENITISNNRIIDNTLSSINLEFSDNCTIRSNIVIQTFDHGVRLRDSHNCLVEDNYFQDISDDAINKYENSGKLTVKNNVINNAYHGVTTDLSSNSVISDNNITNVNAGIYLVSSGMSTISNNRINSITGSATENGGIYLRDSPNSVLDMNVINKSSTNGIFLDNSDSSYITNSIINATTSNGGLWIRDSSNMHVADNNITNSASRGIYFQSSTSGSIINNEISNVNGYGIRLYNSGPCTVNFNNLTTIQDRVIDIYDEGDSPVYNITGNWIQANNKDGITSNRGLCTVFSNIIKNTAYNGGYGIRLHAPSTIYGNFIENFRFGIAVITHSNSNISKNMIINSSMTGIVVVESPNTYIIDNTITNGCADNGIYLEMSGSSTVSGNKLSFISSYGINLYGSPSTTVTGNVVTNTSRQGIYLQQSSQNGIITFNTVLNISSEGIAITGSSNTIVNDNIVDTTAGVGITIGSSSCSVTGNTVAFSNDYGISTGSSLTTISNNIIHHINGTGIGANGISSSVTGNSVTYCDLGINSGTDVAGTIWYNYVANNVINAHQKFSRGTDWDNGTHGNWWDDYTGPDWNQDGIGDLPYIIEDEFTIRQDNYPLVNLTELLLDVTAPTIDSPSDISFILCKYVGQFGEQNITWNPHDINPSWYNMTVDGVALGGAIWNGGPITYVPKNLVDEYQPIPAGVYNYTITVFDRVGNSISDTIIVTIIDLTPPTINPAPHFKEITFIEGSEVTASEFPEPIPNLQWAAYDATSYSLFINSELEESGEYSGQQLDYNIRGLTVGVYNYTIVFYDEAGNSVSDTVIVTVLEQTSTSAGTSLTTSEEELSATPGLTFPITIGIFCLLSGLSITFRRKKRE